MDLWLYQWLILFCVSVLAVRNVKGARSAVSILKNAYLYMMSSSICFKNWSREVLCLDIKKVSAVFQVMSPFKYNLINRCIYRNVTRILQCFIELKQYICWICYFVAVNHEIFFNSKVIILLLVIQSACFRVQITFNVGTAGTN